ncbi:threalose-6-phosphate phosphatase [Ancistrocladus abbreviatus]
MPGNKYNGNSPIPTNRVERLVRERELRKSSRVSGNNEPIDSNNGSDLSERDFSHVERFLEGAAAARQNEGFEMVDWRPSRQRLLVVANRLPVAAVRRGEDAWSLEISAGGLVSALLGVKEFEARWIGWAGVNVPDEVGQKALTKALAEKRCIPVFLDEEIVHQYYNGYCNNVLWPLFHYLGLPQEDRLATTRSFQSQFVAYKKANQMFADVVNKHYEEGDVVWCHDYHLMFLPECLKEHNRNMKVGWFLHTPFPSSEIHRTLPSRSELLKAVLAADLVGHPLVTFVVEELFSPWVREEDFLSVVAFYLLEQENEECHGCSMEPTCEKEFHGNSPMRVDSIPGLLEAFVCCGEGGCHKAFGWVGPQAEITSEVPLHASISFLAE